uniref:RING-type E3 ubiquitin transferase n=1 Tax=Cyprinus carpio TaxID=7962 RepID=A0A8C2BTC7_CYPCA
KVLPRSAPLSLEEARCPVCSEILLEPVTMPCGHSVCLHCFQRTVKLTSLCCPLCRLRVSSWARKQSREKSLVNAELWELIRLSHPERCKRRMEQRDGQTVKKQVSRFYLFLNRTLEGKQRCFVGGRSHAFRPRCFYVWSVPV